MKERIKMRISQKLKEQYKEFLQQNLNDGVFSFLDNFLRDMEQDFSECENNHFELNKQYTKSGNPIDFGFSKLDLFDEDGDFEETYLFYEDINEEFGEEII
jgi:hypothetical protein